MPFPTKMNQDSWPKENKVIDYKSWINKHSWVLRDETIVQYILIAGTWTYIITLKTVNQWFQLKLSF